MCTLRNIAENAHAFGLPSVSQVKVDVFLDLECEKSARAWPILKRAASDQRKRVEFVFHVDPIGFSAAKVRAGRECA